MADAKTTPAVGMVEDEESGCRRALAMAMASEIVASARLLTIFHISAPRPQTTGNRKLRAPLESRWRASLFL